MAIEQQATVANGGPPFVIPEPAEVLDPDTPTIRLCGKDWPVPELAPRQNRIIIPLLAKITPKMMAIVDQDRKVYVTQRVLDMMAQGDIFDDLLRIVFTALTRAHKVSYEQFLDWPLGTMELVLCIGIITQQTGLMKKEPHDPLVQAQTGPATASLLNGMKSSPVSASEPDGLGTTSKTNLPSDAT